MTERRSKRKIKNLPASPDDVSLPTATASSSVLNLTEQDQNINSPYQLQHISFDVS